MQYFDKNGNPVQLAGQHEPDKITFSEVQKSDLLTTLEPLSVLPISRRRKQMFLLEKYMPFVTKNVWKIEKDISTQKVGGMTPLVSDYAESPILQVNNARSRMTIHPATFRQKVTFTLEEIGDYVRLGSRDQIRTAREKLEEKYRVLDMNMWRRIEFTRRQILFEGGAVEWQTENGYTAGANYSHPAFLEPTAGTLWDQPGADPVSDIQEWIELFEDNTSNSVGDIVLPSRTFRYLRNNTKFIALEQNNLIKFSLSPADISRYMIEQIGSGITMSESRNKLEFSNSLVADVASGVNTIVVATNKPNLIEVGMNVSLHGLDMKVEVKEVSAVTVNGSTTTVQFTTNLVNDYSAGSILNYFIWTVPQDKLIMFASPLPESELSNEGLEAGGERTDPNWGSITSTLSAYNNFDRPAAGIYRRNINRMELDPQILEQVIGVNMVPEVNDNTAWLVATIF